MHIKDFSFTNEDIDELDSLLALLDIEHDLNDDPNLPASHWRALAYMAIGKARAIALGLYDMGNDDDAQCKADWPPHLLSIASKILSVLHSLPVSLT